MVSRLVAFALIFSILLLPPARGFAWPHACQDLFVPMDQSTPQADASPERAARIRAYAMIGLIMVASAAATTHLTAILPPELSFLSHFVGYVGILGVSVYGTRLWGPLSSKVTKLGFPASEQTPDEAKLKAGLDAMWFKTYSKYTMNAQMSRNVLQSYLNFAILNLHEARRAAREGEYKLSIDFIAITAVHMRRNFAEIDPEDPSVTSVVQSLFTRHVQNVASLREQIEARIREGDPDAKTLDGRIYYSHLLNAWLQD